MAIFHKIQTDKNTMKTKFIFLTTALVISATGCEQKSDLATQSSVAGKSGTQKIQDTVGQKNEVPKVAAKNLPKTVESSEKKPAAAVNETAEQSLAKISTRSREVTKTQESKSRSHAQNAEDEMLKDLEKFK
jgi:hypothetical protein